MLPSMHEEAIQPGMVRTAGTDGDASVPARKRRKTRGQSMVEFALILPVLLLIFALAADFGRAFTAYIAISSAAREGASFGMMSSDNAANTGGIEDAALADAPTIWGTAPVVTSNVTADPAEINPDSKYFGVNVTVTYTFSPIISIPPIPNSIMLSRTVRMRVLN